MLSCDCYEKRNTFELITNTETFRIGSEIKLFLLIFSHKKIKKNSNSKINEYMVISNKFYLQGDGEENIKRK